MTPTRLPTLVVAVLLALAGPGPATADERVPVDAGPLEAGLRDLQRAGGVGIVARVTSDGTSWVGSLGSAAPGVPAAPEARFRAASITKSLTSVLALQMVDRGRWTMRTTIGDVLPGLWPRRRDVTLRQLLSHTSGVPEHLATYLRAATSRKAFLEVVSQPRSDRALVAAAKKQRWRFRPGTGFGYSNTGYVVVGMMLEKATGTPLATLMRERVFAKAGMTRSALEHTSKIREPELHETGVLLEKPIDLTSTEPSIFSAAGALATTTEDLDRFQLALSSGRLLPRRLVRLMRSEVVPDPNGLSYGLGSYRLPDPCRPGRSVHGHDGATFGTLSMSFATPRGGTRVTVSMTGRNLDGRTRDVRALSLYVVNAFAARCGAARVTELPAGAVDHVVDRLARPGAR